MFWIPQKEFWRAPVEYLRVENRERPMKGDWKET